MVAEDNRLKHILMFTIALTPVHSLLHNALQLGVLRLQVPHLDEVRGNVILFMMIILQTTDTFKFLSKRGYQEPIKNKVMQTTMIVVMRRPLH